MSKKILYVYAPAGPPLDYCFPKIAARGEVHTCIVSPPSASNMEILRRHSRAVHDFSHVAPAQALEQVRALAQQIGPDAIFTFSEFLLKSVSELAAEFGLRAVGPNIALGRNKVLMRERWHEAGIPQPAFRAVRSEQEISRVAELNFPVLVKLAYGAGSIGQQIVNGMDELPAAIERLIAATEAARRAGKHEFSEREGFPQLIAEEIIQSTTTSWYDEDGYGDYLSVEGLVRDGVYYPLAMTGRLRTIAPFTELGNVAPCVLSTDKKAKIVALIKRSIDALGFENCATHTELKLMADGEVSFLETAARMGGVAIAKELDEVFGIDYVDLFLSVILGEPETIPAFEQNAPRCAAASVALIACDSRGTPWQSTRGFAPERVNWGELLDDMAEVHIQYAQSIVPGSPIAPYDISGGLMNYAGQAFLVSPTPAELKRAAYQLLDGLEQRLPLHG
ncbi:acetyl-CoA carboxylase biotin carboxylase subunit family protein [Ralstonia pseudosolanacearum]|uniref:ATP-grasp domain-containing protein n=1 Tax=Ralstonia pseudosolanacearum TaxID=1310165 RepID=UPI001C8CD151|nr:acetyl-CoA carboxylase biotin carboxylase subunit family protein [Ralstonia pseudosolanacearum]MBX9430728.1 acetyl-CoA carboxylase biotin carboxylase subunit family protein [Ralstonia pseudosolanacearum]